MKADFLPKELDGIGTRKYTIDHQYGKTKTNMHWHDCIEIVYIEEGEVTAFFDNKWYNLKKQDMLFVPPGRLHFMFSNDENTIKSVVGISKSLICDENEDLEHILMPFETDKINEHCFFKDNGELKEIFDKLNSTIKSHYGSLIIQAEILRLYAYIYNEWNKKGLSFIEPVKNRTIFTIIKTLENDFTNPPDAYEMADLLHISYSHMHKIISDNLGTGYKTLLNSIRIENAKKMLLTTDISITDIALECGYTDSSYFIKMFKRSVGISPKKYRQNSNIKL